MEDKQKQQMPTKITFTRIQRMLGCTKPKDKFKVLQDTLSCVFRAQANVQLLKYFHRIHKVKDLQTLVSHFSS